VATDHLISPSPDFLARTEPPHPGAAGHGPARHLSGATRFVRRYPVATFLLMAYGIFWTSWTPVLFLGGNPRLFSALGALVGLAIPAFVVTGITEGRAGISRLRRRALRWRVGIVWYVLAMLAVPLGAMLLTPVFLGPEPLQGMGHTWPVLITHFAPQLLLAVVTVQFFEELGWAGFVQHRLQARHGALKASLLVALAFAFLHLPTYLSVPINQGRALNDLSVMVIVVPFAIAFRILIAYTYNRTGFTVLIAAVTHASFNEASEIIAPNVQGPLAQLLAFAAIGLLALIVAVGSKGSLAYVRDRRPARRPVHA